MEKIIDQVGEGTGCKSGEIPEEVTGRRWRSYSEGILRKNVPKCVSSVFSSTLHFFLINWFILIGGSLLYNIVVVLPYIHMSQPWVSMCSPSWTPLPPPSPPHPSGSSQRTSPEHPVSCIEPGLAIYFTYNIHDSMLFSQIIHPHLLPQSPKSVLYICVSFAVSHIGSLLPSF